MELFETIEKGAEISECGKYRYRLWRKWDNSKPLVLFIMLNPSTADGADDDPTIRRCIGFARSWCYGGILVGNIFPYRATNPKELNKPGILDFQPSHRNWKTVMEMTDEAEITVLAFGVPPRDTPEWLRWLKNPYYLKATKAGFPSHPLYLKKELTPLLIEGSVVAKKLY